MRSLCQTDDPGRLFPAPDDRFASDGNVRIVDKNVTPSGHGTLPTGARDYRLLPPADWSPGNRRHNGTSAA